MHVRQCFLLVLISAVFLNACSSWRVADPPVDVTKSTRLRLTLKTGDQLEVREAYARSDTLFGLGLRIEEHGLLRDTHHWDVPQAIPLENIAEIQAERADSTNNTMMILIGVTVVVSLVVLSALAAGTAVEM